jgi:hypothetical protein
MVTGITDNQGRKKKKKKRQGEAENTEEKQKSGAAPTERQPKNREEKTSCFL